MNRRTLFKTIAIVLGVTAGLVIAEVGLRIRSAATARDPDKDLARTWNADPHPYQGHCGTDDVESGLAEIVRPSPFHDVVYELKPNVDTCFFNARIKTNAEGLRANKSYARPKPAGTWRMVIVGDSQTFGHGVAYDDTWGAILERELAKRTSKTVEVINTGVSGYNTAMEAEHLARYGIEYQPDCIAILFLGNDLGLPHLLMRAPDPISPRRSFLFDAVREKLFPRPPDPAANDRPWFTVADGPWGQYVPEEDLDRVPAPYRHMVGPPGYRRALEKIASLAKSRGAAVINFADYKPALRMDRTELVAFQQGLGIVHPTFSYPYDPKYFLSANDTHLDVPGTLELSRRMLAGLDETKVCLPPP